MEKQKFTSKATNKWWLKITLIFLLTRCCLTLFKSSAPWFWVSVWYIKQWRHVMTTGNKKVAQWISRKTRLMIVTYFYFLIQAMLATIRFVLHFASTNVLGMHIVSSRSSTWRMICSLAIAIIALQDKLVTSSISVRQHIRAGNIYTDRLYHSYSLHLTWRKLALYNLDEIRVIASQWGI